MDIIVGTAGHIDHGKTALVKALTGVDADRLPEEKKRGITIDLGFAEMSTGDVRIGFVDVPGHERFVKNMLAGASGIDLVLLVVAADEGVMPQTREHFDICRLLRVRSGVIALTKSDAADADMLALAGLDVAEMVSESFLEAAPIFVVSSRTGEGIDALKEGLERAASEVHRETGGLDARLAVDRSFSVKGFGAVVTGTLAAGEVSEGDELELLPSKRTVRVRGIQAHGKTVLSARAGQRTAINLAGIAHHDVTRGMVLAAPGTLSVTQVFDAEVEVLQDAPRAIKSRQRVRLHIGTAEVLARISVMNDTQEIQPGSTGFVQFRLEAQVAAAHGDRFIIRSYSPQRTIAGGRILDPVATRHRRVDLEKVLSNLRDLSGSDGNAAKIFVRMAGERGVGISEIRRRTGLRQETLRRLIDEHVNAATIVDAAGVLISTAALGGLEAAVLAAVEAHHRHDKLSRGMSRELAREQLFRHTDPELFRFVANKLEAEGKIVIEQDILKLATHQTQLSPAEKATLDKLRAIYLDAGLEVPKLADALRDAAEQLDQRSARKIFQFLIDSGELISVTPEFYFPAVRLSELTEKLRGHARASGDASLDVGRFKEIAGVSRKYAIPLLEYYDRTHVTRRVGDKREVLG